MPTALAPVGLCGMYARRGEVQPPARRTTKAFRSPSLPFPSARSKRSPRPSSARCGSSCMSCATAALCAMRWSAPKPPAARRWSLPSICRLPRPLPRRHSGMSGPNAALRRYWQAVTHPQWAWDVGLNGRPHDLAISPPISANRPGLRITLAGWRNNFDPSISMERPGVDPRFLGRSDGDQRDPRSGGRPRRGALRR